MNKFDQLVKSYIKSEYNIDLKPNQYVSSYIYLNDVYIILKKDDEIKYIINKKTDAELIQETNEKIVYKFIGTNDNKYMKKLILLKLEESIKEMNKKFKDIPEPTLRSIIDKAKLINNTVDIAVKVLK